MGRELSGLSHWEYLTRPVEYGSDPGRQSAAAAVLQRAREGLHQQGLGCLLEGREGEAALG